MLHEFLDTHRADLINRCRAKVALRAASSAAPAEPEHGVPRFLDQLIRTLHLEQPPVAPGTRGRAGAGLRTTNLEIGATATRHGQELLSQGFTVDQVVHDYGDLCQAVTELAIETGATITVREFRTLNRCLDDAIASAVAAFSLRHESRLANDYLQVSDERARTLLRELQVHVQAASFALTAVKDGNVGLKGATGTLLDRNLISMRTLIDRSLADVRGNNVKAAPH